MSHADAAVQDVLEIRNPADGTLAGRVPVDTAQTVAAKVDELRVHQRE